MKVDANDFARKHGPVRLAATLDGKTAAAKSAIVLPSHVTPIMRCLDSIQPQAVRWLWPARIPLGKLTMLAGDPGLGKSFVTLDIATHVSRGTKLPDGTDCESGATIILTAEDDAEDTIRPRLEVMGADLARVHILDAVRTAGQENHFSLATDLAALEDAIRGIKDTRLVIIDPISAYVGKVDSHKNSDVRGILSPLSKLIAQLGVAVLAISHNSKGKDNKAVYRSIGSIAFNAAARAVWSVVKDQDDPLRRLMLPVKMNLCVEPTGLAYRLKSVSESMAVVEWESKPITITADEAMVAESAPRETKSDAAELWLARMLANGPVDVTEIKNQSKAAGFSWRTVEGAKDAARVEAERVGGIGGSGRWQWQLRKPSG